MKIKAPVENLRLLSQRREWVPGKIAVWAFLIGLYDVWPFRVIFWESVKPQKG